MTIRNFLRLSFAGLFLLVVAACTADKNTPTLNDTTQSKETKRMNVLLVVADDLGYTDLGSFGGEIETPNLDALANDGVQLTNFYTAPTCSPTRAMLLTSNDNHLVGLGSMAEALAPNQRGKPGYEGYLNDRATTMPETFSAAGYRTIMAGKWHLGMKAEQSPKARGFETSYALLEGGAGHLDASGIISPKATYRENDDIVELPDNFYSSRFYTDKMIEYIDNGKDSDQPFFGYLAYTAPHWPLQAPRQSIEKYQGKYAMGYEELHKQRVAGAIKAGVIPASSSTRAIPKGESSWEELSEEQKLVSQRKMEIYAAMVDDMDSEFGRLMAYLESSNQLDNTIIFFMSDNGAEDRLAKPNDIFSKHIERCCDNSYENLGNANSYAFTGPNWARASVGTFSDFKGRTTEGGIKAAAILRHPNLHKGEKMLTRFATVKDVMPTLLELADVPELEVEGKLSMTGNSMLSTDEEATTMAWELHGNKAIRSGDFKLVKLSPLYGQQGWQLFDLANDPGELNDVSEKHPEIASELLEKWAAYEKDNGIIAAIRKPRKK